VFGICAPINNHQHSIELHPKSGSPIDAGPPSARHSTNRFSRMNLQLAPAVFFGETRPKSIIPAANRQSAVSLS
jgi:hypothetical protein